MDDWQQVYQFAQSVVIGVIFSYLLAKLISTVVSFREENLTIVRATSVDDEEPLEEPAAIDDSKRAAADTDPSDADNARANLEDELVSNHATYAGSENASVRDEYGNSDDDWEGVESTELDETFSAATAFVAAAASDRLAQKVSNEAQLQLYGLYKIATEGPCTAPQPSALKMTARAKWQAWQKLGAMPPEEAMEKYIAAVFELYPTWAAGSASTGRREGTSDAPQGENRPMGPVFSTYVYEEESGNELKMDAIHGFAREGDEQNLLKCIESGVPVNLKDSEGRTPLHWAVDRGHDKLTEVLISKNADVNAKDNDGQTPLHYAAVCERKAISELLVKQNADSTVKDNDGNSAYDLSDKKWSWLQHDAVSSS